MLTELIAVLKFSTREAADTQRRMRKSRFSDPWQVTGSQYYCLSRNGRNSPSGFMRCAWRNPRFKWLLDGFLWSSNWRSGRGYIARIYYHIYKRSIRGCTGPRCLFTARTWRGWTPAIWHPGGRRIRPAPFLVAVIGQVWRRSGRFSDPAIWVWAKPFPTNRSKFYQSTILQLGSKVSTCPFFCQSGLSHNPKGLV